MVILDGTFVFGPQVQSRVGIIVLTQRHTVRRTFGQHGTIGLFLVQGLEVATFGIEITVTREITLDGKSLDRCQVERTSVPDIILLAGVSTCLGQYTGNVVVKVITLNSCKRMSVRHINRNERECTIHFIIRRAGHVILRIRLVGFVAVIFSPEADF